MPKPIVYLQSRCEQESLHQSRGLRNGFEWPSPESVIGRGAHASIAPVQNRSVVGVFGGIFIFRFIFVYAGD
jgi:hypothetical protein